MATGSAAIIRYSRSNAATGHGSDRDDVINNKFAKKAIEKGADGLVAVATGANQATTRLDSTSLLGAFNVTGNGLSNRLTGSDGANTLLGLDGEGARTLVVSGPL